MKLQKKQKNNFICQKLTCDGNENMLEFIGFLLCQNR